MNAAAPSVLRERHGATLVIRLNKPELRNAFDLEMRQGIAEAVFEAREVDAEEARALGIVYEVVPEDQLLDEALAMAARFHGAATQAIGISKNILNRSFNLDQDTLAELEAAAQAMVMKTDYHQDAVARFLNKQPRAFEWPPKRGTPGGGR